MENKELIEFENKFYRLINFTNEMAGTSNLYNIKKDKSNLMDGTKYSQSIEYVFKKLRKYCKDKGIQISTGFDNAYIYVICENESMQQQIYKLYCPFGYISKSITIVNNLDNVDFPIINFKNVIKYYNEKNKIKELEELRKIIIQLKNQGLSSAEIENHIKNTLSNENNENKKIK
jgi:hypothetical protein